MLTCDAGAASSDISPRKPTFLCGYPHAERTSTGIHDPLLATALYLSCGDERIMLIAVDNLFVEPKVARAWRRAVAQATAVPQDHVFISTSHTHSGPHTADVLEWGPSPVVPEIDPDYMRLMQDGIVDAATRAARAPVPAEVAWTSAMVDGVGCNRHAPEHGLRDPEAGILVVRERATRRLLALSVTYSMHPTVMHEDSTLVSADFPGYTRLHLREQFGDDLAVCYHTGPAGDQSPRWHVKGQTFAEAERLGRRLGATIAAAVSAVPDTDFDAAPQLASSIVEVALPWRKLPAVAEARANLERVRHHYEQLLAANAPHGPLRTAECDLYGAEETLYLAECGENGRFAEVMTNYDPVDVQALRIGNACLIGFPGELYVGFGLAIKSLSPRRCFAINLVNGDLQGYVVTAEAIRLGHYESGNRAFGVDAGARLVNAALAAIQAVDSPRR